MEHTRELNPNAPQEQAAPLSTDGVLSRAETRIACGYVSGLIGKEIASACGISHNTVIRHTQNIYEKAGIPHSTNALVAWFLEENCKIDLAEFRRRVGCFLLFLLVSFQTVNADFDNSVLRRFPSRRVEGRRGPGRRGRRNEEGDTLDFLTTI